VAKIPHATTHPLYPGACYAMSERSFGRALALWENMLADNPATRMVGLRYAADGVTWDCYTPNRDESESHHRILAHADAPWQVFKVEHGAGNTESLVPAPFATWANLDAAPTYDASGRFTNLRAWNEVRLAKGQKPYVARNADDKHLLLVAMAKGFKFQLYTYRGQISEYTLNEIVTGYTAEMRDWLTLAEFNAVPAGAGDADSIINY